MRPSTEMTLEQFFEKLKELGITSTNAYLKTSFNHKGELHVGCFERELRDDFYFYNKPDGKIYKINKFEDTSILEEDNFQGNLKYLVPLDACDIVWEDKPFVQLPTEPFNKMDLRQYAAIHLKVPQSGLAWLDEMIKQAK